MRIQWTVGRPVLTGFASVFARDDGLMHALDRIPEYRPHPPLRVYRA